MNRFAFSKPTQTDEDTELLFGKFRQIGYDGLQLKAGQYKPYLDEPQRFIDERGQAGGASGMILVITLRIFDSSSIRCFCVCSRPAVSIIR